MNDNITLPREVVEEALEALELEATSPPLETTAAAMAALRTALAAEQPVPTDKDSLTVQSRLDAESFREERDEARALLNGVLQDIEALRRDAEKRHPDYVIGNHWFETAYERLCAGEAEDAILEDYELVREPRLRDLRRDAERYRWLRERAWFQDEFEGRYGDSGETVHELDAAIDAAMEASTAPASAAADSSTAPEAKP